VKLNTFISLAFALIAFLFAIDANAATTLSGITVDTSDIKGGLMVVFEALAAVALLVVGGSIILTKIGLRR
jgi:hypothetical protein